MIKIDKNDLELNGGNKRINRPQRVTRTRRYEYDINKTIKSIKIYKNENMDIDEIKDMMDVDSDEETDEEYQDRRYGSDESDDDTNEDGYNYDNVSIDPKCVEHIRDNLQFEQGSYSMCWFISLLNNISLSDGMYEILSNLINLEEMKNYCKTPDIIANYLENEIKNKLYIDIKDINNTKDAIAKSSMLVANDILKEYINRENDYVFSNEGISGGFSYNIIVPYLVKLKFPINNIKHILIDFDNIIKKNYDPRDIKINRLCQEILRFNFIHNINIKIFILTIIESQEYQIFDIENDRNFFYNNKYICFIKDITDKKIKLLVYILDCAFLASNNNNNRMGHMISMLTCNKKGYIVNSFKATDDIIIPNQSCSIYKYDWYNWKSNEYFYHKIGSKGCKNGMIINKNKDRKFNDKIHTSSFEFLYNKNIGNNSLIYTLKEYEIDKNNMIESIHNNDNIQPYYYSFIKPYLYLLMNDVLINSCIISFNNTSTIEIIINSLNYYNIIQKGIQKGLNCYIYKIEIIKNPNNMKNCLKNYLPDDIIILQDKQNNLLFYFIVEYFRNEGSSSLVQWGGI